MRRLLGPDEFASWFTAFLPEVPAALLEPATVSDRTDPKMVHLDGLNLSRAWCWRLIGPASRHSVAAAEAHIAAALPQLSSGAYVGEHWLGTFALLALTDPRTEDIWDGRGALGSRPGPDP